MITNLPIYIYITFLFAVVFALVTLFYASNKNLKLVSIFIFWGLLQSVLSITGFYDKMMTTPPRFLIIVLPMFAIIIGSLFSSKMQHFLKNFNLKILVALHTVRIFVELVLYWLFVYHYVPELMTFEGRNFDILAGLTAPLILWFGFRNNKVNKKLLFIWNLLSLGLLVNIIINAVLAMPSIMQQFAFDQPNIGITKVPFLLLPAVIVPIVLLAHIAIFATLKNLKSAQ